ncbi:substrate-binding domain-containing protein [Labrys monachus]|uniref:ABC-type sugar transport system substrate-binding protein n=1 Tax=Labrys monachus TaxID=217067 RepID=A0ABU0FJM1_9HYPH|nr:substrate-binding domain-containing protein [Labrys monachus]MDQ0394805.1 ABC-type sugar transport system substrate-binding protein [Labrys monachus]
MERLIALGAAAAALAFFAQIAPASAEDAPLVAFSQEGLYNSWRTANNDSILAEAKKAGLRIQWVQADGDQSKQVAQVQNLLKLKPKILILEPAEQQAATPIAAMADEAGVPLIVADRGLGVPPGKGQYKMLIEVDWNAVGVKLGEAAVETLKKKKGSPAGNIVEIVGTVGSTPQIGMDAGLKSVISKYPDIKVVATQDGHNERGPGLSIMENFLTAYPQGQIDLVFAQNDEMAIGALKAIQAAGRDELLGAIISKDGQLEAVKEVANGNFAADCTNTPYFGPILMPYVKDILDGKAVPASPPKPFVCISSVTDQGKQEAQALLKEMQDQKMAFAPR